MNSRHRFWNDAHHRNLGGIFFQFPVHSQAGLIQPIIANSEVTNIIAEKLAELTGPCVFVIDETAERIGIAKYGNLR